MPVQFLHIAVLVLFTPVCFAQALRHKISHPYLGSTAYSQSHSDAFSPLANTASLAALTAPSLGLYVENRFLLEELKACAAILNYPTPKGNFAVTADYFGFEYFRETQIGAAFARKLGSNLNVGIKFNYYSFQIPRVIQSGALTGELGLMAAVTEQLCLGMQIYNPVGGHLSKTGDEKLASHYSFGVGFQSSENFSLSTQIHKQQNEPVNVEAAAHYRFADAFFARAGVATQNQVFFGGAGWRKRSIRIEACASVHPQLGISPGMMIIYDFKRNDEMH